LVKSEILRWSPAQKYPHRMAIRELLELRVDLP